MTRYAKGPEQWKCTWKAAPELLIIAMQNKNISTRNGTI